MRYHQLQPKNLDYKYHLLNSDNIQTLISLNELILKTSKIKGDVIEFGVGRGRSLIILSSILSSIKSKKKLYAFDSFEGFGNIHLKDNSFRKPKKGEWSKSPDKKYKYNIDFIKRILKSHLHKKNKYPIKFVKGFIETKLPKFKKINKISFIHCDVDLYLPHKIILENMWSKLSKGGIILFDDIEKGVKSKKFPGAALAFKEFFKNRGYKLYFEKNRENIFIQKR